MRTNIDNHKLEAELRFLKAQINPHFLFNALNNIYSLSFTKSEKAPDMILKLSEMMSFMLYDCKEDRVFLKSEIAYLENYISLQKLKKAETQDITLEVIGKYNGMMLRPMLFIPFYENAIKHGNVENPRQGFLHSRFTIRENELEFSIKNSVGTPYKSYSKGGIGLENIKRRLRLLYPSNHTLKIEQNSNIFSVYLKLII